MAEQFHIAIDGPAGAGKSTVAQSVAKALSLKYLDTGAMYRAVTFAALAEHVSFHDGDRLGTLVGVLNIKILKDCIHYYFKNEDITGKLRSVQVNQHVSTVSKHIQVRKALVALQRKIAKQSIAGVVMDGRDIGTNVLPEAQLKIFLTASIDVRTRRRLRDMTVDGQEISFEDVKSSLLHRDRIDQARVFAPLKQADDAILIDTSEKTITEVVDVIVSCAQMRRANDGGKHVL